MLLIPWEVGEINDKERRGLFDDLGVRIAKYELYGSRSR
jgi:hypothetical protein